MQVEKIFLIYIENAFKTFFVLLSSLLKKFSNTNEERGLSVFLFPFDIFVIGSILAFLG